MPKGERRPARHAPAATGAEAASRLSGSDLARQFDGIMNGSPQMLWMSRADGSGGVYNRAWHDFVGAPPGTITFDTWAQWVHPDDRDRAQLAWRRALSAQDGYEIDYRLRHHSGDYRWVTSRGSPTYDACGCVEGWLGTTIDIDDRKKAELLLALSEQRYRALTKRATWSYGSRSQTDASPTSGAGRPLRRRRATSSGTGAGSRRSTRRIAPGLSRAGRHRCSTARPTRDSSAS